MLRISGVSVRGWATSWVSICTIALIVLSGCGKQRESGAVSGAVTLDGQLASFGSIAFHPLDDGPIAYGTVREDGSYTVRTGRGDLEDPDAGVIPTGQYVATVVIVLDSKEGDTMGGPDGGGPPLPGQQLSPRRYGKPETSPLMITVRPGENLIPLELERESQEMPSDKDGLDAEVVGQADTEAAKVDGTEDSSASGAPEVDEPGEDLTGE